MPFPMGKENDSSFHIESIFGCDAGERGKHAGKTIYPFKLVNDLTFFYLKSIQIQFALG